jgi:hypothetical protein
VRRGPGEGALELALLAEGQRESTSVAGGAGWPASLRLLLSPIAAQRSSTTTGTCSLGRAFQRGALSITPSRAIAARST